MRRRASVLLLMVVIGGAGTALLTGVSRADGGWLDTTPVQVWNLPAMPVPEGQLVLPEDLGDPRCATQTRPAETAEDQAVVDAGWYLVGEDAAGWGLNVVTGASSFDGMCRPLGYQQFVFADGAFAGTVSPVTMDSRTDGAIIRTLIADADQLTSSLARYGPQDPLCCPSRESLASYHLARSAAGPVLLLDRVFTQSSVP